MNTQATFEALKAFKVFVTSSVNEFYCYGVAAKAGTDRRAVRELFKRMVDDGEMVRSSAQHYRGRASPRTIYSLTPIGMETAKTMLAQLQVSDLIWPSC